MLTTQRKHLILARLAIDGQILAKALATELGTSEDTIRRDLRELAQEGKLQRVHGGALPASAAVATLAVRAEVSTDDKVALGRAGAAMVQPGQLVLLDGGTTPRGRPYLVMELVDGLAIGAHCESHALGLRPRDLRPRRG